MTGSKKEVEREPLIEAPDLAGLHKAAARNFILQIKENLSVTIKHALLPACFYLFCFCGLTYPLIANFHTRWFTDSKDGLMGVWNLWWVNAVLSGTHFGSSIWHTDMLHWPFGITLLGHTLVPFDGYLAALLLKMMPLVEAHNSLVVFSFVMSGVSAYWLAVYVTRSAWASLVAGYIFTFSSYHFAHYNGHLNLIAMQWIPLFVMFWSMLMARPRILPAICAALSLYLVLLCDYYYFLYCLMFGVMSLAWGFVGPKQNRLPQLRTLALPISIFAILSLALDGMIIFPLISLSRVDPFLGSHDPLEFSLDLFGLLLPGGYSRFSELTRPYWANLMNGNIVESNVYLGWSVILLLLYLWHRRSKLDKETRRQAGFWMTGFLFFTLLAFGPQLQLNGNLTHLPLPYALLEIFLPFMRLSGVPVRMVVMVVLFASILCAQAVQEMLKDIHKGWYFLAFIACLLLLDSYPRALVSTSIEVPKYIDALALLPDEGGVLDLVTPTQYLRLYYQTIHQKPITYGYVARIPSSVFQQDKNLKKAVDAQDYYSLWDDYRVKYLITDQALPNEPAGINPELVFQNGKIHIYKLTGR